jgi:hypothetical protein
MDKLTGDPAKVTGRLSSLVITRQGFFVPNFENWHEEIENEKGM